MTTWIAPLPKPVRFDKAAVMRRAWDRARQIAGHKGVSVMDVFPAQLADAIACERERMAEALGMRVRAYLVVLDFFALRRREQERTPDFMAPLFAA